MLGCRLCCFVPGPYRAEGGEAELDQSYRHTAVYPPEHLVVQKNMPSFIWCCASAGHIPRELGAPSELNKPESARQQYHRRGTIKRVYLHSSTCALPKAWVRSMLKKNARGQDSSRKLLARPQHSPVSLLPRRDRYSRMLSCPRETGISPA